MPNLNVYEMYAANGNTAGFFVSRDSWAVSTYARVLSIAGHVSGPLPGKPPYHGNPEVRVDFYFKNTLKHRGMKLSCPGNYSYEQIPAPRSEARYA